VTVVSMELGTFATFYVYANHKTNCQYRDRGAREDETRVNSPKVLLIEFDSNIVQFPICSVKISTTLPSTGVLTFTGRLLTLHPTLGLTRF
jgi:hypothetical protein